VSFQQFSLDEVLQRAIEACGYTQPTEIQQQAIPVILQGRDVMASAQTGTGKTAAFVLPMLQRLLTPSDSPSRGPRVLVLTPTRELAQQVTDNIKQLGRFVRLNFGAVVGGVAYGQQEQLLRKPLDILIATPGRLMDHMAKGRVDFSRLELMVLDEADRMLDMGFIEDVEHIAQYTPESRQTLLFSATLEGAVLRVAQKLLKDPVSIQVASVRQRHDAITQHVHQADDDEHKHALLGHWLSNTEVWQAIVFTATKRGADDLAERLTDEGHAAASLHGDMKQSQRNRTVERLKRGKLRVLVATDVAARGLDIKGITHVINFNLPKVAEDYVHRIGRTGRGGASGTALSLVGPDDHLHLKRIERLLGQRLERSVIAGLEPKRPEPRVNRPADGRGPRRNGKGGFKPHGARHGSGGHRSSERSFGDRAERSFDERPQRSSSDRGERTFNDRPQRAAGDRPDRKFSDRPRRSFSDRSGSAFGDRPQRSFSDRSERGFAPRPERARSERQPRAFVDSPEREFGGFPATERPRNQPSIKLKPRLGVRANDGTQPMRRVRRIDGAE
jgi:superfamily II DNA/RNA helicase